MRRGGASLICPALNLPIQVKFFTVQFLATPHIPQKLKIYILCILSSPFGVT
jgi:hypothetical protein